MSGGGRGGREGARMLRSGGCRRRGAASLVGEGAPLQNFLNHVKQLPILEQWWVSYKEEEGMGEERRKPALLLEVEEEVVGAALLGLGGGKRIPCVRMREGAFPAHFFGFIILSKDFLTRLNPQVVFFFFYPSSLTPKLTCLIIIIFILIDFIER